MLIAIEGCVGVGKTTIAQGLAKFRQSTLLLEDFSAVPFLNAFYEDPVGCALETEFSFLLQHYHQLRTIDRTSGEIVADFALDKDLIFADLNMTDDTERRVFVDLYDALSKKVPKQDLTIFVRSSDELVLNRIQARGRPFELAIEPAYYRRLNAAYEVFFSHHRGAIIRISADEMNFCSEPQLFPWLSSEVDRLRNTESVAW